MGEKRGIGTILKLSFKWSWLATLPVVIVFSLWAAGTWRMYYDLKLKYIPTMPVTLESVARIQAETLRNRAYGYILSRWTRKEAGLPAIHLYMKVSDINRLDSDLPYSGREYVPGKLLYPDGNYYNVSVKYRGDFSYHWSGVKKSMRVKTKKGNLYKGLREFNLIIPKSPSIVSEHLSYLLARRMGLLAPESSLVELWLNGEYIGVSMQVEQLEEQFLRRNSRMPGDLYVGELVGRDAFPAVGTEVFLNPDFWTKAAINNHNPPEWDEALRALSKAVYSDDAETILKLVDIKSWARFAAYTTITRTVHFDADHNWRLFFDPAMGTFQPVVWDPLGWNFKDFVPLIDRQTNRMDVITNLVLERLHRDHRFLLEKHAAMEEFFSTGGDLYIEKAVEDTRLLEASLRRDMFLQFESSYMLTPGEAIAELKGFKKQLSESLADVKKSYLGAPEGAWSIDPGTKALQVNVSGFRPMSFIDVEFDSGITGLRVKASYKEGGRTITKDLTGHAERMGRTLRVRAPLLPKRVMSIPSVKTPFVIRDAVVAPVSYLFDISGAGRARIISVKAGYAGRAVDLRKADNGGFFDAGDNTGIMPVDEPKGAITWAGDVLIDGVREIDSDIYVKAGTTIRFTPGSSLIIRGRLETRGEEGRPVRFVPASPGQAPWGAVVLTGSNADGSVLRNSFFEGGSGVKYRMVEYSAMLSVHGVKDVAIEGCRFSDSLVTDDMVHLVYSTATIRDSVFTGALSDALDLDYVTAKVINSSFSGSGNDALDLMSSTAVVTGSRMSASGDKGISVGEGTDVFVWNSRITGNNIGVQAKDGSRAVLYNVELTGNKKTVDAYKKNWQYGGGGTAFVLKSRLVGESPAITADKDSSVTVYDSFFKGGTGGSSKGIRLDPTADSDEGYARRSRTAEPFGGLDLKGLDGEVLRSIDPGVRGVLGDAA